MFILKILGKNKRNEIEIFARKSNSITKYYNSIIISRFKDQEARFNLTNTQLNKLKSTAKNKTETMLRLNKKDFEDEELSHELFLTTIQATKLRN